MPSGPSATAAGVFVITDNTAGAVQDYIDRCALLAIQRHSSSLSCQCYVACVWTGPGAMYASSLDQ
jgi:hypothetical protein